MFFLFREELRLRLRTVKRRQLPCKIYNQAYTAAPPLEEQPAFLAEVSVRYNDLYLKYKDCPKKSHRLTLGQSLYLSDSVIIYPSVTRPIEWSYIGFQRGYRDVSARRLELHWIVYSIINTFWIKLDHFFRLYWSNSNVAPSSRPFNLISLKEI